jgi:ferric-dicitrate binding protein FerR (iron transport regulator)
MAKTKQAKSALPYARRLIEDQYVHEQLQNAAARLRQAYGRISRQRGKAAEDKKLYGNLREAATSIRKATLALQRRRPEPKRRGRKVLLVVLAGGGAAVILSGRGRERLQGVFSSESGASADGDDRRAPEGTSSSPESDPAAPTPT